MRVFLPGHWPTLNQLNDAKANKHAYHRLKMAWQRPCALVFKATWRRPTLASVSIAYHHVRKTRQSDKGNLAGSSQKIIEDALVDAGVIIDDGWDNIAGFAHTFEIDPKEGVWVTVTAAAEASPRLRWISEYQDCARAKFVLACASL